MTIIRRTVSAVTEHMPQPLLDFVYRHRYNPLVRQVRHLALRGLGDTTKGVTIVRGPLSGMVLAFVDVPAEWSGVHEPVVQQCLLDLIKPGDVVYDIGAHVGYYVLLAAKAMDGTGHIVAYEPEPETFRLLETTVARNDLGDMVTTRRVALAQSSGKGKIAYGTSSLYAKIEVDGGGDIELTTIDEEVGVENLPPPTVVIIDAEGLEEPIFEGGRKVLTEHRPRILAEHHLRREVLIDQMATMGYTARDIDSAHILFEPSAP